MQKPVFTGMALDRAEGLRKDPDWVQTMLHDPAARAVAAGRDGVLLDDSGEGPVLARRPVPSAAPAILLGLEDGAARFAVDLDSLEPALLAAFADGARVASLRDAGAILPGPEAGLAAYLLALLNWHLRHRFCSNCGTATDVFDAGLTRRCPHCGATHFPRMDPVVIMLVEHDQRLLLGRHAGWPPGRFSALAGFVSPGEALEEAVVREVFEESGIEARDPVFVASQPWPFPSSLMLGFHAFADGGEPVARDGELEEVRWFTLAEIRAALAGERGELGLPPSIAIAHFLIERWVARIDAGD
jgi:NAD+ diphosphatase